LAFGTEDDTTVFATETIVTSVRDIFAAEIAEFTHTKETVECEEDTHTEPVSVGNIGRVSEMNGHELGEFPCERRVGTTGLLFVPSLDRLACLMEMRLESRNVESDSVE